MELEFKEIKLNGKPLWECEMVLECNNGNYRLYVDKEERGFYALALEFVSCSGSAKDTWLDSNLMVQELFNVIAYWDGVRHLEFNRNAREMAGYIYCPDMEGLIKMFQKVREIELEICSVDN